MVCVHFWVKFDESTLSNKSCSLIPAPPLMLLAKDTNIPTGSEFTEDKNFRKPMSLREAQTDNGKTYGAYTEQGSSLSW